MRVPILSELELQAAVQLAPSSTLREVAGAMEDAHVSCVLLATSPPWIVTEHDLAGALAAGMTAESSVSQVATKAPVWATTSTTLEEAVSMMIDHGIRHLVVITPDGKPKGVLSINEAIRMLLQQS